jgi:hypothetical protein
MVVFPIDLPHMGSLFRSRADGGYSALCVLRGIRASARKARPARVEHRVGDLDGGHNGGYHSLCVLVIRAAGLLETGHEFPGYQWWRSTGRGRQIAGTTAPVKCMGARRDKLGLESMAAFFRPSLARFGASA